MNRTNSIVIQAPLHDIFEVASDLERWPDYLSHYKYNKFLSKKPWGGVVKMCAVRDFITTAWVSEYRIKPEEIQLEFKHLRSTLNATRGMEVIWHFNETDAGVKIDIVHIHQLNWPIIGGLVNDYIVGWFFIHYIANKTLAGLKHRMEKKVS